MKNLKMKTAQWSTDKKSAVVTRFLSRPAIDASAEAVARPILEEIRQEGDGAVIRYAQKFDTPELAVSGLKVSKKEIAAARKSVDRDFLKQAREADKRIFAFAKAGKRENWEMETTLGGRLGEQYVPLDRVGVYIPGGTAPLASTSLMTATIARAAGVKEIVACTPANKAGEVNPFVLTALDMAGVTEIYRIGGVQAIGAMAYGTKKIAKVQKIVGPGNAFVTAAKKLVYGEVSLDSVAGPSEVAIFADDSASAAHIAADLLAQAEHGTGHEKALLVTPHAELIEAVGPELMRQAEKLSRYERLLPILKTGVLAVQVPDLEQGMELINQFAAEHLELLVRNPRRWAKKVRAAGAIFLGHWTPESAGDFAAGPSHVLPTGGAAAMFSGLTVDDFMRRSSLIQLTRKDLREVMPVIEAFGRVEGLDGHVQSARVRFGED
ncbi:histidinol dehydrogenase [Kiritimatiellaeota bacterium B1221]|nr:histidinol dehydrogenase [Kiritimatiellaeota bacterium B1221]